MFRRRRLAESGLEGDRARFEPIAVAVDRAQRALLAAIPTSRDPGVPLGQALAAFLRALDEAARWVDVWEDPSGAEYRARCAEALADARREAERLRLEEITLGFETLNARIGDVLEPLDTFADIERALRRRR